MSGGHFDYKDSSLQNEIFNWGTETTEEAMLLNPLKDKEISGLTFDLLNLIHTFDWAICGDSSMEKYYKEVQIFKAKWLNSSTEDRAKQIVDLSLNNLKEELYQTFGISSKKNKKGDTLIE